jgi:hypothetical protein
MKNLVFLFFFTYGLFLILAAAQSWEFLWSFTETSNWSFLLLLMVFTVPR